MLTELSLKFLDNKHNETVRLLYRTHLFEDQLLSTTLPSPHNCLQFAFTQFEINRIYKRLDEVLIWLMLQRSIARREIPPEIYDTPRFHLQSRTFCIKDSRASFPEKLDPQLATLMDESRTLYLRILRIDGLLAQRIKFQQHP